jgi:hypothetical protein
MALTPDDIARLMSEDEDDDDFGQKLGGPDLAERLNDAGVEPFARRGKIILSFEPGTPELQARFEATPDEDQHAAFQRVSGEMDTYLKKMFSITDGWLESHPQGSDRGGYIPYVEGPNGHAYYDMHDGGWF